VTDRFGYTSLAGVEVYVYGASGHGKVVADVLLCCGLRVAGFVDDAILAGEHVLCDLAVSGDGDWLRVRSRQRRIAVALGIGTNNQARARVAEQLLNAGMQLVTAVHPRATVAESAEIGGATGLEL
jgi:hypothetical protein